ncbi:phosphatidylinositol mannoside acyltransferase [Actinoallomurus rhizosphaericola]|uniref:phosphatidylinositol mannoside acyltransferase n=1 Tax=Actinoallomurus rhizosphaericola TaxID=2952536 RepID=UPI0020938209|nr:phosphatidylinositol mannoside acyltransferase [Actinoallomurus rhizosphaericola]MCO5996850.1 phosphatidylinositol mannoside acyltransferase [Actinoallomurus rhizosphaericola]
MRDEAADAAYALGWAAVRRLPEPVAREIFMLIADRTWRQRGRGVRQLEKNLRRVVGPDVSEEELRGLSRRGMRSYMRYWMEAFRLPATSRERILSGMRITGIEDLRKDLDAGRGVVAALPHMGNYDHAGAWISLSGVPFTTVMERLRPESLYDRFIAYRASLGMEVLPATGGDGDVFRTLAARLREARLVCLVADRDLTASGVEVEFFGRAAKMPAGPAALAIETGAALRPVTLWYEGDDWGVRVHEEIPVPDAGERQEKVRAMTQSLADAFAGGIAAHPEDWHMLQRVWLEDLR